MAAIVRPRLIESKLGASALGENQRETRRSELVVSPLCPLWLNSDV
jgi:hypothetical protein